MLLGFISLLLTATSSSISNICIPSKFYNTPFTPCTKAEADEHEDDSSSEERKLYTASVLPHLFRRMLNVNKKTCKEACNEVHITQIRTHTSSKLMLIENFQILVMQGYEPFVSYEGLEQLHRFIFIMAVTHISYSCLTMLLAIVKVLPSCYGHFVLNLAKLFSHFPKQGFLNLWAFFHFWFHITTLVPNICYLYCILCWKEISFVIDEMTAFIFFLKIHPKMLPIDLQYLDIEYWYLMGIGKFQKNHKCYEL